MLHTRDKICEFIQLHNNFTPYYNQVVDVYDCITDYEVESTMCHEYLDEEQALLMAQYSNTPVKLAQIGPLVNPTQGLDYVDIYITSDNRYLAKRFNIK